MRYHINGIVNYPDAESPILDQECKTLTQLLARIAQLTEEPSATSLLITVVLDRREQ